MSYQCQQLADFICDTCLTPEKGRVRGVAFTKIGVDILDPSDPQVWKNIECNDLGVIIPAVRGNYDGGSILEGPGYGSQKFRQIGTDHTVVYNHLWSCENKDFYDSIREVSDYEFWMATESKIFRSVVAISAQPTMPITDDVASELEFQVTVKWSQKQLPQCYDIPGDIFESCAAKEAVFNCLDCQPLSIGGC